MKKIVKRYNVWGTQYKCFGQIYKYFGQKFGWFFWHSVETYDAYFREGVYDEITPWQAAVKNPRIRDGIQVHIPKFPVLRTMPTWRMNWGMDE